MNKDCERDTKSTQTLDGVLFTKMLIGGASRLAANIERLNQLNVFPVPDGDTGTNMAKTFDGGIKALSSETDNISEISNNFAKGVLLSARGNSGVILSQIFAGINEGLKDYGFVGVNELAKAYQSGIQKSYSAVQNPTEGTILTVFRESTEYASSLLSDDSSFEDFFKSHVEQARRSLEQTKEILPVLAQADVVDSGAAGYLCVAEGMLSVLTGEQIPEYSSPIGKNDATQVNIDSFTRDSKLEFGYCTEFLLRLTTDKVDPDNFEVSRVLDMLNELGGESIVAYKQDDIVKVHVHTFTPGDILSKVQSFGEFLTVKIENMSVSHSGEEKTKTADKKPFCVVAVANGEGMSSLFTDMGADVIIEGGQTANPSTREFIDAFKKCNSDNIIVLPNNKNILLAAKQSAELFSDAKVHIIETKNLMQGFSALSVITPGITDTESIKQSATRAANSVIDGEITKAVRDANIDGVSIKKGDFMAISGGKISAVAKTAEDALLELLEKSDTDFCEIITLFCGKEVSAERRVALTNAISENYPDCEVTVYEGGQPLYDYFVAIE